MKFEYPDKFASEKSHVPTEPHWAILEFKSILVPGDQRSKDCPGHGYPEHTEKTISYEVYLTEEKWKNKIEYKIQNNETNFFAIKAFPAKISSKVIVETKIEGI